jgi:hypothetical protein
MPSDVRLLDRHYDPAIDVDLTLSAEALTAREVARLQSELALARVAASFPRRLSEGTRDELALDKKRSRRVAHALEQSLRAWKGKPRDANEEERRAGAQVRWPDWAELHGVAVNTELRTVSTWAKATTNLRFGRSAVVRLEQELDWVAYALRD